MMFYRLEAITKESQDRNIEVGNLGRIYCMKRNYFQFKKKKIGRKKPQGRTEAELAGSPVLWFE